MTVYVADGTTFARGDAATPGPEVFTPINQVKTIAPLGQSRGLIDISNLSSSAHEYMKALKDGEEIALNIQYDPGDVGHNLLRDDFNGQQSHNYQITLTNDPPQTCTFAGQVIGWQLTGIEVDSVVMLEVKIKPSADLEFSPP